MGGFGFVFRRFTTFYVYVCIGTRVPRCACGGQNNLPESPLSFYLVSLHDERRSPGLAEGTFSH